MASPSPAAYHLLQFEIFADPADPRRVGPEIGPQTAWLDVGCGAGVLLRGSERGVGVDADVDALRLGRGKGVTAPLLCCMGEALPFADGSFEVVTSRVALPYMEIGVALREFARVLRPGGRVWLALHGLSRFDLRQACSSPLHAAYEAYKVLNTAALHVGLPQFRCPEPRRRCESYQTDRGMKGALERAGFADIQIARKPHYIATAMKRQA